MDGKVPDKRIAALAQASKKKQNEALARTEKAIEALVQNKHRITVRAVAKEAGVSVSYIYKYPELAYKIQSLRDAQRYDSNAAKSLALSGAERAVNSANKETVLVEEIEYLKTYIAEIESEKKSVIELQKENAQLQIDNKRLKQELEFTKQNLAEIRGFVLDRGYEDTQNKGGLEVRERVVKQITQDNT